MKKITNGYTLIEAMVAIIILLLGVVAAASLAMTITHQEEVNLNVARALSYLENTGRLFQLGLTQGEIAEIMPPLPNRISLSYSTNSQDILGLGDVDVTTITLSYTVDPENLISSNYSRSSSISVIQGQL